MERDSLKANYGAYAELDSGNPQCLEQVLQHRKIIFPEPTLQSKREIAIGFQMVLCVVGEYVHLINSGRTYKGLCPFHKEKTPSFHVIPDKQIYHCFGCDKGGDVFSFLMRLEHLTFPEAVRFLAAKQGIEIPKDYDPEADKRSELYRILDQASKLFALPPLILSEGI